MADPLRQEAALWLREQGWDLSITRGGHVKGVHPQAASPLFFAATSGDKRQVKHVRAQARRLLREQE